MRRKRRRNVSSLIDLSIGPHLVWIFESIRQFTLFLYLGKEKEEDSGSVAKANDDNVVLYLEKEVQTTDESLGQGKHADHHANEFDQLCDHVMSSCTALHNALHDVKKLLGIFQ